jgi:preprotein translocase subunit SecA
MFLYSKYLFIFNKLSSKELTKKDYINYFKKSFYYRLSIISIVIKKNFNIIPFKQQIIASVNMFKGINVEMYTGEGKSISILITALLKVSYNFKVHIMTVNNYLANRDFFEFKNICNDFDLIVNCVDENSRLEDIIHYYYDSNIIYSSVNSLLFNFLNDVMSDFLFYNKKNIVRDFLIIDELDQIIVDYSNQFIISSKFNINTLFTTQKEYVFLDKIYKFIYNHRKYFSSDYIIIHHKEKYVTLKYNLKKIISYNFDREFKKYKSKKNIYYIVLFLIKNFFYVCCFLRKNIDYIIIDGNIKIISMHTGRIGDKTVYNDVINFCLLIKEKLSFDRVVYSKTFNSILLNTFLKYYNSFVGTSGTVFSLKYKLSILNNSKILKIKRRKKLKLVKYDDVLCKNFQEKLFFLKNIIKKNHKTCRPIIVIAQNLYDCEKIYNFLLETVNSLYYSIYKLTPDDIRNEQEIIDIIGDFGNILVTTNICSRGTDIKLGGKKLNDRINYLTYKLQKSENEEIELKQLQKHYAKLLNSKGILMLIYEHSFIERTDLQIEGRVARKGEPGEIMYLTSKSDKLFNYSLNPMINLLSLKDSISIVQRNYENISFNNNINNIICDKILDSIRKEIISIKKKIFFSKNFCLNYILKLIKFYYNFICKKYKIKKKINLNLFTLNKQNIKQEIINRLKFLLWKLFKKIFLKCNEFHNYEMNIFFFNNLFSNKNVYCEYKKVLIKFARNYKRKIFINNIDKILNILLKKEE